MALPSSILAARRFGYGLKPGETPPGDVDGLMLQVQRGAAAKPRFPREGLAGRRETIGRMLTVRAVEAKAAAEGRPNPALRQDMQAEVRRIFRRDALARMAQAVSSENGFFERLASFWLDHFSVSARKAYEMRMVVPLFEAEALRPNLAGPFRTLLRAAVLHPAMLIYLDAEAPTADAAAQPAQNTRLARELLELHTLGEGAAYTADDLQAAAHILGGLAVDARSLEVSFRPAAAGATRLALLGQSYADRAQTAHLAMLDDLAARPDTVRHICGKLAVHFIADAPPEDLVADMVAAWQETDGRLDAVYRAMLSHPSAWDETPGKIIPPFDFVISGFRSLERQGGEFSAVARAAEDGNADWRQAAPVARRGVAVEQPDVAYALTLEALGRMGQPIWQPPSAAGFPDGAAAWLYAGQLRERLAWARLVARTLGQGLQPADYLEAALGGTARAATRQAVAEAPSRVQGLTLVLASPEFNRR
ncbi:DUF1800 family protein [Rhizobium sp. CSW-27]|uniref:DUF1800 domain-containing protein n=1 Tax=Rhizobium sp. CSW-27 TaxID=2839985 RepID=UPI001C021B25|nr:DUF1800 family protein [Rhizobium sp. CSW-27]MBT9373114.1 DUF1800 domain-containing protein [Rhizobium sp. CSW-27]